MIDQTGILNFVKKQSLCVLSTVTSDHKSESAVMAFSVKDDFTFFFSTEPSTRKFQNLTSNSAVSIVVGGLNNDPSVQLEGTTIILENPLAQAAQTFALNQHPELKDYLSATGKWIEVKIHWLRHSDFSKNPPEIVEFKI